MGVGVATVSSVEAGREPLLSTLRKFAEQLPGATARVLLAPDSTEPEPACRAAWLSSAKLLGFAAERVRVQAGEEGWSVDVEGIHGFKEASRALEVGWLAGVCVGSPLFLREFDPPRPEARFEDGEDSHEFRWGAEGLEYSFRSAHPRDCDFVVEYPIEELTLSAPRPAAGEAAVLQVFPPDGGCGVEADIARHLHPTGVAVRLDEGSGRPEVTIAFPVLGLRYVLGVAAEPLPAGERAPGAVLADARHALGLSLRDVAERSGLDHRSVLRVEKGVDPKVATLRALLTALPNLAPQDLLPTARPPTRVTASQEWGRRAACFGFAADELVKSVDLEADGLRTTQLRTLGLRPLRRGQSDFQIRVGLPKLLLHAQPDVLIEFEAGGNDDMTVKHVTEEGASDEHELGFRGEGAAVRFNYIRTYRGRDRFVLTADEARSRTCRPAPYRVGASIPVRTPMRCCRLVVKFPEGYEPIDLLGHLWPSCFLPDESLMLAAGLRRLPIQMGRRGTRLTAELSVRRPVVGLALSLSWELS